MFTLTESAQEEIAQYFKKNEIKPVRVFLSNGCGGQQLAMGLDEVRPDDAVFSYGGFEFAIEQSLMDQAQPIEIDFTGQGFKIFSALKLVKGGCSGCGSSGECCG